MLRTDPKLTAFRTLVGMMRTLQCCSARRRYLPVVPASCGDESPSFFSLVKKLAEAPTQCLTMGTEGSMKGDIRARIIIVDGKVEGDLYATESVNIRAAAKVRGNVYAPRVAISDGAFFQGRIDMQPSGAAVQEASARARKEARPPEAKAEYPDAENVEQLRAKG